MSVKRASQAVALLLGILVLVSNVFGVEPARAAGGSDIPLFPEDPTAPAEWSITASPNASNDETTNFLGGMTCVSSSDCWAVGYYLTGHIRQTLIQHWDGMSWQTVPSPDVSTTEDNVLQEVACASTSDCWAVGSSHSAETEQTLIQHWDGTAWTIVSSGNAVGADDSHLNDVACTSASNCWAVGYSRTGTTQRSLMMRWDGIAWSVALSPEVDPTAPQNNQLNGVSCTSASNCWAVGYSRTASAFNTLTARWDGTTWSFADSPNASTSSNFLNDVTCVSAADCWSVGYARINGGFQTLVERWDGTDWTVTASPNASTQSHFLRGVSCATSSDCWAVGAAANSAFAMRWDGSSWTIVAVPDAEPEATSLYDVSCLSASDCTAIGHRRTGTLYQTFALRWDATSWAIVASPNVGATQPNHLMSVTCRSECWAVGHSYTSHDGSVAQTVIQRWDGDTWALVPSPNAGTQHNFLHDVDCLSSTACWAVGSYLEAGVFRTLVLRWDGSSWEIVPSPNAVADEPNRLHAVSCAAVSDCWAVGYAQSGSGYRTLIQHWDGSSWDIVSSPNTTSAVDNLLFGVTCVSSSDCWSTGYDYTGSAFKTLIQHWDGTSWELVASPNTSPVEPNFLRGVECTSATECWAVGHYVDVDIQQSLILRWDGTSWSVADAPSTSGAEHNFLEDVTCASRTMCWAVGRHFAGAEKTLIARWDGASWAVRSSPNASASRDNILSGVACAVATGCWAVGFFHAGSAPQSLILRYAGEVTGPEPNEPDETDLTFTASSASSGQFSDAVLFEARLTDSEGNAVPNQDVVFELAGTDSSRSFEVTTDDDGIGNAVVTLEEEPGPHELTVRFAGNDSHASSVESTSFLVAREDSALELTVSGRGIDRTLEARLSDLDTPGSGIAGATVDFYADGELIGSSTTTDNGVATLQAPPRYRGGKHEFEARFEGDLYYLASSAREQI